jgi:hypothetical protein
MPYVPPSVTLNQLATQTSPSTPAQAPRTVAILGQFPQGPAICRVAPNQAAIVGGDPTAASSTGYNGPRLAAAVASQLPQVSSYPLSLLLIRCFDVEAAVSCGPFTLSAAGQYAGSRGNNLSVAMNAPQAVITEVQRGTATLPEIQLVTIYNCAGGSGAGLTLAFKGTAAGTPITPTNLNTFNATAIAASINGISTIPTATVGGSGGAVTVAQATTQVTGAVAFTVTFPVSLTNGLLFHQLHRRTAAADALRYHYHRRFQPGAGAIHRGQ